jgi:hypothetical protein
MMRPERVLLRSRQQTGIFEGFWTIADQILRPNERPKIPIAGIDRYLQIRLKQGSR